MTKMPKPKLRVSDLCGQSNYRKLVLVIAFNETGKNPKQTKQM